MTKQVGRAVSHESAAEHVTGRAQYVDDMWTSLSQCAHAWPVCAPHAHARVCAIDSSAALKMSGVLCVLTAADVPGENDVGPARRDEALFPSEVCFHGQAVAWVIAETEQAARDAAKQVSVEYEPLPAILTIAEAIAAESFLTEPERMQRGAAGPALHSAAHRLHGQLCIGGQEHFYIETQAALAFVDESGTMFAHSSTQHPTETQAIIARVLGLHEHRVVVQCLRMGGAFGGKETQANSWAALAALAAYKLKRPVRVRLTRQQDFTMTGKRHPFFARFDVGFDDCGKLQALDLQLFSDGGYSLDLSQPIMGRALFHADNCYYLPNVSLVGRVCRTHHVSHTAFRGFGGPQGMLVIEDILSRIASELDLPAHEVRARNFYSPSQTTHYGQVVKDAARIARIWTELMQGSDFSKRAAEIARWNEGQSHRKRGLAITPVKFGISFTTSFFNQAGALVLIYRDGSVQVNHGGTEMGQGLHTKILAIAADALGVPLDVVRIMPTRTDKVPNTSATAASSGSDLNGAAVHAACETLRERLAVVAADGFGVAPEEVVFEAGAVYPRGKPELAQRFGEVVDRAYLARVSLAATGYYRTPGVHYDRAAGRGEPFHYFAYGAAVAEVELDGFTGQHALLQVDILHDVGQSLSPVIDRSQIEGGFMQGVGYLTTEELLWDSSGRLSTQAASTYKLPTFSECPRVFNVSLLERAHEPGVVHGSKAVGEPPLMLAISVREALRAAIAAFGKHDHATLASPITPEVAFWAIERARANAPPERAANAAQ